MNGTVDSTVLDELPRGAGQIQYPDLTVRHFQFTPPSPEDAAEAQRAAAERAQQFDIARREAEQRAREEAQAEEYQNALLQNANMSQAEKAIEAQMRFQGMRGFERDLAAAKAAGLSPEQATLQALSRNSSRMFYNQPEYAARSMISATQSASRLKPGYREIRLPSGRPAIEISGPSGYQIHPETERRTGLTENQKINYVTRQKQSAQTWLDLNPDAKESADPERKKAYEQARAAVDHWTQEESRLQSLYLPDAGDPEETSENGEENGSAAATGTIYPLPKTKEELVSGRLYDSRKGVVLWNGKSFVIAESR